MTARGKPRTLDWLGALRHTRITATPQVLAGHKIAAEVSIPTGFWDKTEYEATTGTHFVSLTPVGRPD